MSVSKYYLEKFELNYTRSVLKLVAAIFIKFLFLSPNDSHLKTMKNAFYFIQKALFVFEIFNFLYLSASLFFYLSAIALEDDRR